MALTYLLHLPGAHQSLYLKEQKRTQEFSEVDRDSKVKENAKLTPVYVRSGMKWEEHTDGRCWFEWELTGTVVKLQWKAGRTLNEQVEKKLIWWDMMCEKQKTHGWMMVHYIPFDAQPSHAKMIATWWWLTEINYTWHQYNST